MKKISLIILVLFVTSCSEKPLPLLDVEQREFLIQSFDLKQDPVGSLSIYDSVARAFENSLVERTKTLSDIINQDLSKTDYNDILPKIVEIAGYKARYNPDFYFATLGSELETKPINNDPAHRNTLAAVWDMIDFALNYTTAKQYGDPTLLDEAIKRKAMENVASDVKLAFYRVAGSEQIKTELKDIEGKLRHAIANLEKSPEKAELDSYKTALTESLDQVLALKKEAIIAKLELSSLLGLGKYTDYTVQPPVDLTTEQIKKYTLDELEIQALSRHKSKGMVGLDSKEELLFFRSQVDAILPDAEFGFKDRKDYDYFQNQAWEEAGLKISWNLISLMNTFQAAITKEERENLRDIYTMALGTSILSEVNISYLRFSQSLKNFQIALVLSEVKQTISKQATVDVIDDVSDLDMISKQIEALLAKMKIYYAYGELKDAEDMLLISIGAKNYPTFIQPAKVAKADVKMIVDGEKTEEPVVELNLDGKIEPETWANQDGWLEGAAMVQINPPAKTAPAPTPLVPQTKPVKSAPTTLIDVSKYSTPPSQVNQPRKATVTKKKIAISPLRMKNLQVGSYNNITRAETAWTDFTAMYPELENYSHKIESADVNGKTMYRLFVSGEEKTLRSLCKEMSSELGGSCIVR